VNVIGFSLVWEVSLGSLQSLDWNEQTRMVDWNGGIADLQFGGHGSRPNAHVQ